MISPLFWELWTEKSWKTLTKSSVLWGVLSINLVHPSIIHAHLFLFKGHSHLLKGRSTPWTGVYQLYNTFTFFIFSKKWIYLHLPEKLNQFLTFLTADLCSWGHVSTVKICVPPPVIWFYVLFASFCVCVCVCVCFSQTSFSINQLLQLHCSPLRRRQGHRHYPLLKVYLSLSLSSWDFSHLRARKRARLFLVSQQQKLVWHLN